MTTEVSPNALKAYEEDARIACQYGVKCYQKNSVHHKKYKHPPTAQHKNVDKKTEIMTHTKLEIDDSDDDVIQSNELNEPPRKKQHIDESDQVADAHSLSTSQSSSSNDHKSDGKKTPTIQSRDVKEIISELFLIEMPDEFYKFYDFCSSLLAKDPTSALKSVDLKLVGPFDVLSGKISEIPDTTDDKEKYLRHWRYFYDPPEFQTVLKGNDKQGLHYGYWRDDCKGEPIFVAKNYANTDYKISPIASNIFGAVKYHLDEKLKVANPFQKINITRISKALIEFSSKHGIKIEKKSQRMKDRDREVVAKTLHGAGIVVPYNKTTQLGYRTLSATDSDLRNIFAKISNSEFDEIKTKYINEIEEIIRWATIAADECDFGTPLELGHDLFVSGIESLQKMALNMFVMAYGLLERPQFMKIATAHMKDRKKGSDLSVI